MGVTWLCGLVESRWTLCDLVLGSHSWNRELGPSREELLLERTRQSDPALQGAPLVQTAHGPPLVPCGLVGTTMEEDVSLMLGGG